MKRFYDKVSPEPDENGCLRWMGATRGVSGYGAFLWRGVVINAHRAAWEIYNNATAPPDMVVRHTCDNRWCVAPMHLVLGTPSENTQDILARGRWGYPKTRGERHHRARLTERDVRAIRAARGTNRTLAEAFGVSVSCVAHIKARHTWRHLED